MSAAGNGTLGRYLSTASVDDFQIDWTLMLWVCPSGGVPPEGDGYQVITSLEFAGGAVYSQLYLDQAPNNLNCRYNNVGVTRDELISGGPLSATLMTLLAIAHTGGNQAGASTTVYRGNAGADMTSDTYANDPVAADAFYAFNWSGNTEPLNGELGQMKVWNRVLTLDELYFEYRRIAPGMADGLTRFYPLLDGSTSPGVDRSGAGNDMTLTGALVTSRRSPVAAYLGSSS